MLKSSVGWKVNVRGNVIGTYHLVRTTEHGHMIDSESLKFVSRCDHVRHGLRIPHKVRESGHNSFPDMLAESKMRLRQHILRYKTNKTHIPTTIAPIGEPTMDVQSIRRVWWR